MEKYKFLEHTADLKVQAFGKTLEEVFINSALAMKQVIAEDIKVKAQKIKFISVEGKDLSELLYNFLEEFLFMLDADNQLLAEIEDLRIVEANEENKKNIFVLNAEVLVDKASNYKFTNDVKAITYNEMYVKEEKTRGKKLKSYRAQFVLDV